MKSAIPGNDEWTRVEGAMVARVKLAHGLTWQERAEFLCSIFGEGRRFRIRVKARRGERLAYDIHWNAKTVLDTHWDWNNKTLRGERLAYDIHWDAKSILHNQRF